MRVEEIHAAYAEYSEARRRLIDIAPCTKCCPPHRCCEPGYCILGCDIKRCPRCGGDGFLIDWEDNDE